MQSIWDDFVAQRAVIKQMVSPTSVAERGLYMSWGETGYATQESALHWVAVPTHLLCDLAWCVCLAWPPRVHRQSTVLMAHGTDTYLMPWGHQCWGTGHQRATEGGLFCAALLGRFHPAQSVAPWYLLFFLAVSLSGHCVCE